MDRSTGNTYNVNKEQNTPGIGRRRFTPYPEYKDSGVEWLAAVPASWPISAVKHKFDIFLGKMLQPEPASTHDLQVPYLKAADVQWESISLSSLPTMWASKDEIQTGQVAMGDLLVCEGGEVGRAAILTQKPEEPTIIQNALHRVRSKSEITKFLMYLLEVSASQGWLEVECNKATIQHFTSDKFGSLRIAIPSLEEQRRIVSFLDRETAKIDALIEKKERLIDLLQEKRMALITQAVTKGLDQNVPMKDSGVKWLGRIPTHWELKRLRFVLEAPLKYGANESAELNDPDLPRYVRISDINESDGLRDETFRSLPVDVAKEYLLREGDLLFARSGATAGKTFLYRRSWGACAFAGYLIRARLDAKKAWPDFIRYFTASLSYQQWLASVFIQATIQNVSAERYANLNLPLPPIAEQYAIAAFLDREKETSEALISTIRKATNFLKEYRTALISGAVTGKIDVRSEQV